MEITCGYKKETYEFIVEKSFEKAISCIKGKDDIFSYEILIYKHIDPTVGWNKNPYSIKLYYNNVCLSTYGMTTSNYSVSDSNTTINTDKNKFFILNKSAQHMYINLNNAPTQTFKKEKTEEDIIREKKLKKLVEEKYLLYKNKYSYYFTKIQNVKALELEIKTRIEINFDKEYNFEPIEEFLDIEKALNLCIIKEECNEYIQKNANINNFYKKVDKYLLENIDEKIIKQRLNEQIDAYFSAEKHAPFSEVFEDYKIFNKSTELKKIFDNTITALKSITHPQEAKKIKKKHIQILKDNKNYLKKLIDLKDFNEKLNFFMSSTAVTTEEEFSKKFEDFLKEYQDFQNYFIEFKKTFNSEKYIFELTDNLEEKFKKTNNEQIQLKKKEKAYYDYIYSKTINYFNNSIYIKNTKNLKPTFKNLPNYIEWAKSFLVWLKNNKIIDIEGTRIDYKNIELLKDLPTHLLNQHEYLYYKKN